MTRSVQPESATSDRTAGRAWFRSQDGMVSVAISVVVLTAIALCAIFPGVGPKDPDLINASQSLLAPGADHLLGTDQLGRDVFSRIIAGAGTSLVGPLLVATGVTIIASILAIVGGYLGGLFDSIVSRVVDTFYSLPALLVAIVVAGVTGGGFFITILVLIVFNLPLGVRNLRASVLERVDLPYMEAAKTLGMPTWRIVVTQLFPAVFPYVVATFFLQFTYGVVELSSLSFLGLGVPPGAPDWGRMVAENRGSIFANVWSTAAPAIAISMLAVSTNLIGQWVHDRYEKAGTAQ